MRPLGSTWPALAELFPDGVDAAITNRDGTSTAFFKGGTVANFDHTRSRFETDTPEPIGAAWPEFVRAGIDAAALWPITTANPSCSYEFADRAYIFRGDQYIRYNIATGQVANGFPRPIAEGWPGMPFTSIDAVVVWQGPIDNDYRAYFFKGDQYARYNLCLDRTEDGYPRHINDLWLELAPDG
jgi:hypothetical protein